MEMVRRGEQKVPPFRTERFFLVNQVWYFATREGVDEGPFETREAAEKGLNDFIASKTMPKQAQDMLDHKPRIKVVSQTLQ